MLSFDSENIQEWDAVEKRFWMKMWLKYCEDELTIVSSL